MDPRSQLENGSRAAATWYPAGESRIVARMLGHHKIVLDTRDFSLTPHLVMEGFWESWITLWVRSNVSPTDRLLNIGANCGYYALLAAAAGASVVAVEPQEHLVKNIRLSARLNGWETKIRTEQCVAGSERREVTLQLYPDLHGSAHVKSGAVHGSLAGGTTIVEERPAHELMPDATCAFIDAEGYEPLIWEGLRPLLDKKQLRWVALEWSPSRYADAAAFLSSLNGYGAMSVVDGTGRETRVTDGQLVREHEGDMLVVSRGGERMR